MLFILKKKCQTADELMTNGVHVYRGETACKHLQAVVNDIL